MGASRELAELASVTTVSSGNVGIGTSSPGGKLDVAGTVRVSANAGSISHLFQFNENGGDITLYNNTGNSGTLIDLSSGTTRALHVLSTGDLQVGIGAANTTGSIQFVRAGFVEAMRIDSSGNLGVGSISPAAVLDVVQPSASANGGRVAYFRSTASGDVANNAVIISKFDNNTTTSQIFMKFEVNNTATSCGRINANGANTAAFGSTSDQRVKENIEALPSQLQNILALRPVEFDYIESYGGGHQIGFIAQEMQEVYPDVVSADDSEEQILSITGWSKTEARLVKAIQEQQAMIDELKAKVAALEGASQ